MLALRNELETDKYQFESKFTRVIKYLFFLGITTLGVLLLFEIFIRLFVYGAGPKYIFDPDLGYVYGAGTKIFNGVEGFGLIHFVANGEIATPYSGGKNIVTLGDSHTIAIQVDDVNNYVSVAEKILHEDGYYADLHNYGVMGNRMPDYVYLASRVKQQYYPEIMVIQLTVDDFFGSSFASDQPSYFAVSSDGTLMLKHNRPTKKHIAFIEALNRYSALTTFAYERLYRISNLMGRKENKQGNQNKQDSASLLPDHTSVEMMKMELQALVDAYPDIPIVIVLLPFTPRIQDSDILFQENDYYKILAKTIQNTEGLYLVDPSFEFNDLVLEGKFPRGFSNTISGTAHLNMDGHQIVGRLLAQTLKQLIR
jgi:lysophospholipase L1-like esterase